jgi:PKD repeat protein
VVQLTVVNDNDDRAVRERTIEVNEPPEAQFQISTFEPGELQEVSFIDQSWDPDGAIIEWLWDFGDGSCSTEQTASHVYRESGLMSVLLMVTDDDGASQTASATVNVQNAPPVANLSVAEASRPTGSTFTFDASGSFDPSPNGSIVSYAWSIGEDADFTEETTEPTLTQAFDEDGDVCVRVRVTDDGGAVAESGPVTVTVTNRLPTVSIVQWSPTAPVDGEDVTFTVTASDPDGQINGWTWAIDGTRQSTQESFTVQFDDDGDYEVTVYVTDDDGGASTLWSVTVNVANAAPIAAFSVAQGPTGTRFDATASYDPSPSGSIVHVAWDFGDGTQCPGAAPGCDESDRWTPEHHYSSPGTYTVILFVIDEQGAIDREQRSVLIGE